MLKFTLMFLFSLSSYAQTIQLLSFERAESIELKGRGNFDEINRELYYYGAEAVSGKDGMVDVSIGIIRYPLFIKNFDEVWVAAFAKLPDGSQKYVYLSVMTNNPLPKIINDVYSYHLPLERANIYYNGNSARVRDFFFELSKSNAFINESAYVSLKLFHHEKKPVSQFSINGRVQKRSFDSKKDRLQSSLFLKQIQFIPKEWIVRKNATGIVEVPN